MRRSGILMCLLVLVLAGFGCNQDQAPLPTGTQVGEEFGTSVPTGRENAPPQYYTTYWTATGMSLEVIDTVHGCGIPLFDHDLLPDEPGGRGYSAALGMTFDLDGTAYIINNYVFGENPYLAVLNKIDVRTGTVTPIAEINNHFCGSEIDACGNLYTVGFQPPDPPNPPGGYSSPLYGDKLCRIDKYTGAVTPIGDGTGLADIMDLAFDSQGILWATTENKLYTIDLTTGVATYEVDITNVPPAPPGEPYMMMIMSIAFDKNDVLYGTAIVGFCQVCNPTNSPIMRIDTATGEGTLLGYSLLGYNHGGDTMPTEVRIAHRLGNGQFRCQTISMSALPAHLAHGDYVPGTNGRSCDCP